MEIPAHERADSRNIIPADSSPTFQAEIAREEIQQHCEADFNVFSMVAAPDTVSLEFPPLYIQLWLLIKSTITNPRDFSRYAIGLPRGFAKTMFMKILLLWILIFTKKQFILVICSTAALAENVLADIVDMLDSANIKNLWGNWRIQVEIDRQHYKKFHFLGRSIILKAAGAGTAVRGIAVKNRRPDLILCDDAQTRECAMNAASATEFQTWFFGTLLKTKSPFGCTFLYVGNMYPNLILRQGKSNQYGCLLRNLKESPSWTSFVVGGILADGKSLWEELQPTQQLLQELAEDRQFGQESAFYAEVLNDPDAATAAILDFTRLSAADLTDSMPYGKYIIVDPSGWNAATAGTSDDVAIAYCELHDGIPVMIEIVSGKFTPMETIKSALKLAIDNGASLIACESVAYQNTLLFWFEYISAQVGISGINFVGVLPGQRNKNMRILEFFKCWQADEVRIGPKAYSKVLSQARAFNPLKTNNTDDILDCCAYMQQVRQQHEHGIALDLPGTQQNSLSSLPSVDSFADTRTF